MSLRAEIIHAVADRVRSELPALNRVLVIGATQEFEQIGLHPPSVGLILTRSVNSDTDTPPGEEYAYFTVQIWIAAQRFGVDDRESGITDEAGVYNILDDVHAAMAGWTPDSADEPMRFIESDVEEIGDGLIVAFADYRTARLI